MLNNINNLAGLTINSHKQESGPAEDGGCGFNGDCQSSHREKNLLDAISFRSTDASRRDNQDEFMAFQKDLKGRKLSLCTTKGFCSEGCSSALKVLCHLTPSILSKENCTNIIEFLTGILRPDSLDTLRRVEQLTRECEENPDKYHDCFWFDLRPLSRTSALINGYKNYLSSLPDLQCQLDSHPLTSGFKARDLYLIFIDDCHTQHGPFYYEDEPGYMAAMNAGWSYILQNTISVLNFESIQSLHYIAIDNVCDQHGYSIFEKCERNKNSNVIFQLRESNTTLEGLKELEAMIKEERIRAELLKQDGIKGIDQTIDGPGKSEKFFGYIYRNQNSEIVKEYIESYNTGISNCQTDDKKIRVIAELCRNLEVIHWFADGNARTIGYLLVNQLLLSNGLSPSVIKDANYFDGWSVDQLASMICEGQQKFQGLRSSSHSRE